MVDRSYALYRAGSLAARTVPGPLADAFAELGGRVAVNASSAKKALVEKNIRRVVGDETPQREVDRLVRLSFADYARYYSESFRLPDMSMEEIDAGFTCEGVEHVVEAVATGTGPILVLPHLGGWEWAGFWLSLVPRVEVTVVVEPLQPPELHDWFVKFREAIGMNVVPLGPDAGKAILRAIKAGHVVCLLSDRSVGEGATAEVEFFGEVTKLPMGPAALALRTGCRLLPTAVYHTEYGVHGVVRPPVTFERTDKRLRQDITAYTQKVTHELEGLIRRAPEQWHLMQPNWPSDVVEDGADD